MTARNRAQGLILGLMISLSAVLPAQAAPTDLWGARQHVETLGWHALASLRAAQRTPEDREAVLAEVLQEAIAVDLIGRFVLGRHWKAATPAERADYQVLFREFVVKTYAGYLNGLAGTSFQVVQAVPIGQRDALVTTRIDRAAHDPVQAGWRVRRIEDSYKIIDVVVQGVSLATAQRQDFSSVVGKVGVAGLLDTLRAKTKTFTASR